MNTLDMTIRPATKRQSPIDMTIRPRMTDQGITEPSSLAPLVLSSSAVAAINRKVVAHG